MAVPRNGWVPLIKELARVTKPGGYLELHELSGRMFFYNQAKPNESKEVSASDGAMGRISQHIRDMSEKRGVDGLAGEHLAEYCAAAGLQDVTVKTGSCPIGWNGPIGKLYWSDLRGVFVGLMPFMTAAMGISQEDYEHLVDAAGDDAATNFIYMNITAVTAR
ncbi:hypothetical protein HK405_012516, partial [Cladochytrium tenue]